MIWSVLLSKGSEKFTIVICSAALLLIGVVQIAGRNQPQDCGPGVAGSSPEKDQSDPIGFFDDGFSGGFGGEGGGDGGGD